MQDAKLYTRSKISTIARAGLHGARQHWMAITIPIAILLVIAYTIAFLIDEPLRRYTETKMNRALKGYTARIGKLNFHPLGFSLDLDDVVVTQDEHPEPAVIRLERLSASVHWRALLSGKLVGDIELVKPAVYVNLPQAKKEIDDPTPVKERGWQDAIQAIYPLKINHFEIQQGDVTYVDQGPFKPLHIRDLNLVATDIRNGARDDRRDQGGLRAHRADRRRGTRGAPEGRDRGEAGEQRARPRRADHRAPAHAEHGGFRQQGGDAVVSCLHLQRRRDADEPQQPGGRGLSGREDPGGLHGQRHRHGGGDLQGREIRPCLRHRRARRGGRCHHVERSLPRLWPVRHVGWPLLSVFGARRKRRGGHRLHQASVQGPEDLQQGARQVKARGPEDVRARRQRRREAPQEPPA